MRLGRGQEGGGGVCRFLLADHPFEFGQVVVFQMVGPLPGQEFIQNHAEGVDVRRGRNGFVAHLFRGRILRRHQLLAGLR